MMSFLILCLMHAGSHVRGDINVCYMPVQVGEHFFCHDLNLYCLQCPKNTYYIGACKANNTGAECVKCPEGTVNRIAYHMNRTCQIDEPSTDHKETIFHASVIREVEESNVIHGPEHHKNKEDKSQPLNDNGGTYTAMNPVLMLIGAWICYRLAEIWNCSVNETPV